MFAPLFTHMYMLCGRLCLQYVRQRLQYGGQLAHALTINLCTCLVALLKCFGAHSEHRDLRRAMPAKPRWQGKQQTWLDSLSALSSSVAEGFQVTVSLGHPTLLGGPCFLIWGSGHTRCFHVFPHSRHRGIFSSFGKYVFSMFFNFFPGIPQHKRMDLGQENPARNANKKVTVLRGKPPGQETYTFGGGNY